MGTPYPFEREEVSLRRPGCDYAQGYLFARPKPFEQVSSLLASDPAWWAPLSGGVPRKRTAPPG
ncbi:MAG: hypothetical protein ACRDHB_06635 [Actinomycetota bacterium]